MSVSGASRLFRYWLPVVLWMAVIFGASTDLMSEKHTSRFIGPFLRWLKPDISQETIVLVQAIVRKGGHVTEYAILAILLWRALRARQQGAAAGWSWSAARVALLLATLYAASDEFHQYFVASRYASVWDVVLDSAGASVGLVLIWAHGRMLAWRSRRRGTGSSLAMENC